jgi:hypothetical protein
MAQGTCIHKQKSFESIRQTIRRRCRLSTYPTEEIHGRGKECTQGPDGGLGEAEEHLHQGVKVAAGLLAPDHHDLESNATILL